MCELETMLDQIVFYFFAALAVISAVLVVTRRNVVQSAIFLITALLATAGIFLQLHAEFLFIVQVILYAGGIMVLFVFVIMLINMDVSMHQVQFNRQWWLGLLLALVLGAQLTIAIAVGRSGTCRWASLLRPARSSRARNSWGACCSANTCCRLKLRRSCCWWR